MFIFYKTELGAYFSDDSGHRKETSVFEFDPMNFLIGSIFEILLDDA